MDAQKYTSTIEKLITWQMKHFPEEFDEVLFEHFFSLADDYKMPREAFESYFNEVISAEVFGSTFEDFVTRTYPKGNLINHFLAKNKNEPEEAVQYLNALRESIMSFHEVVDVTPGQFLVLKDLLQDLPPRKVFEREGSHDLNKGDIFAARVIQLDGKYNLTGSFLGYFDLSPDEIIKAFKSDIKARLKEKPYKALPQEEAVQEIVRVFAPDITASWVTAWLINSATDVLEAANNDEEDLDREGLSQIIFPFEAKNQRKIMERLDSSPNIVALDDEQKEWIWCDDEEDEDGLPDVFADISLEDNQLILYVDPEEDHHKIVRFMKNLLGELVSAPMMN